MISGVEFIFRHQGGQRNIPPGWNALELTQRLSTPPSGTFVGVVGDSRVGWGVSEAELRKGLVKGGLSNPDVRNLGLPAIHMNELLKVVLKEQKESKGTLILNFSPASFYYFTAKPSALLQTKQERYDAALHLALADRVLTSDVPFTTTIKTLLGKPQQKHRWLRRQVFEDGFVNGEMSYEPGETPSAFQLKEYRRVFESAKAGEQERRAQELVDTLRRAKLDGWNLILVRLPIGVHMLEIEESLRANHLSPHSLSQELDIPYYDLRGKVQNIETLDQSHLTPESARRASFILGELIAQNSKNS